MYGYSISKSGVAIDHDESQVVREIFDRVISGESFGSISRNLNDRNKLGSFGGRWCAQRIREVVTNEKYCGNALLQKCYRNNHLEKKELPNRGELPMYYAENTHEPIVDADTFRRAQQAADTIHEVTLRWKPRTKSVFTGRILCTRCGRHYKRMINHGIYSWTCETYHYAGKAKCQSKRIPESILLAEAAAALGIIDFSPDVLMNEVVRIEVPEPNHLVFVFTDGHTVERVWANRSRRDSWTDEMRAAARQKTIERNMQRCQTSQ